jgi:alpha-tubulin suppressor-like RCC1 family protein
VAGGVEVCGLGRVVVRVVMAAVCVLAVWLVVSVAGSVAAAPAGQLYAFGFNYYGQLGSTTNNGTTTANPTPALVSLPPGAGTVIQAAAGREFSLVVTSSGQLYAFGENDSGQLGSTTNNGTSNPNPAPTLVSLPPGAGTVTQAAAGFDHSLVVTSSGQLYAFGDNSFGQLGSTANNNTINTPNPTPTLVSLPPGAGAVTQAAAGNNFSLVVTSSGQLYAFGLNIYGQLGSTTNNNTGNPNPTPTLVSLPPGAGTVTQAAAGYDFSLVVTSSGQLYAFGVNDYGQFASTTNNGTSNPNPTPTLVPLPPGAGTVTQAAAGDYFSLVVTSSGQLYAFGLNVYGQLGSTTNNGTYNPNPTPAPVSLAGEVGMVTQVAAGEGYSLVVTSSGQLYAFGANSYGDLGIAANSGTTNANPTPTLVAFPSGTTIDTVAQGSLALQSLAIVSGLAITSTSLPGGQVGIPYSQTLGAAGGTPPLAWSASGLPGGLSINSASGVISGTPTTSGSFPVMVTLTDRYGSAITQELTLAITGPLSISGLQPGSRCVRNVTVAGTPSAPAAGLLTFSFTLSEAASVTYTLARRDGSPQRTLCPTLVRSGPYTTTTVATLTGAGSGGGNGVSLGTASTAKVHRHAHRGHRALLKRGRVRISLARITGGAALTPGTYFLIVTATNPAGEHAFAHTYFWVLKSTRTAGKRRAQRPARKPPAKPAAPPPPPTTTAPAPAPVPGSPPNPIQQLIQVLQGL